MKTFLKNFFKTITLIGLSGIIIGLLYVIFVVKQLPKISLHKLDDKNITTIIYNKGGDKIFQISSKDVNKINYQNLPKQYQNAITSVEDKTFWNNYGINIFSTGKAIVKLFLSLGKTADVAGGSTITQQLIKLSLFNTSNKDKTVTRKIKDIWYALQLTQSASKQAILTDYVNKLYEGNGTYGAQTISNLYYNKNLNQLDLSQTALIAGIGQAPNVYNLYTHPNLVQRRRNEVLQTMLNNNKISQAQFNQAIHENISKDLIPENEAFRIQYNHKFPHYYINRDFIQSVLGEMKAAGHNIETKSYNIHTTLSQPIQDKVYDVLNHSNLYNGFHQNIQSAVAVVNPNNGNVLAQIGGRHEAKTLGINRAIQTGRSSGSSVKPLLDYAPAFKYNNFTPNTTLNDAPIKYPGTDTVINNYSGHYQGKVSVKTAITESLNPPAVETLDQVGFANAVHFLKEIDMDNNNGNLNLTNALGLNISPTQLATGNAIFSNGGTFYNTNYIYRTDTDGNIYYHKPAGLQVLNKAQANQIARIMMNVINSNDGTAPDARISGLNQAGKSGTVAYAKGAYKSGDESDDWMGGFTKANGSDGYSIAVWSGYDYPYKKNGQIHYHQQRLSERIYKQIMEYVSKGESNKSW